MVKKFYVSFFLVILFVLSSITLVFAQGTSLQSPGVGEEVESFLEKEAGICAYVKLNKALDLRKARTGFRTIEKEGEDFIIGSYPVSGYDTSEDVHMFVNKDGWIIAYYGKNEPVVKIIDWKLYQQGKVVTKLYQAISNISVSAGGGLGGSSVKYYHYAYPDANKLMIIVDRDSFKITIPEGIPLYEVSASMGNQAGKYRIANIGVEKLTYDVTHEIRLDERYLTIDNIRMVDAGTTWPSFFALFIVYREE